MNYQKDVEDWLSGETKRRHTTKTRIVIESLRLASKQLNSEKRRPSIRDWAGKLSQEDLEQVIETSNELRQIDNEIWK